MSEEVKKEKQEVNPVFEKADTELNKAIFSFMSDRLSFWALLALSMQRTPMPGLGTITTKLEGSLIKLVYDPEFVCSLDKLTLQEYILHECTHLVYRHAFRFAESKTVIDLGTPSSKAKTVSLENAKTPIKAADVAADIAVHWVLDEIGTKYARHCISEDDLNIDYMNRYRYSRNEITSEDLEAELIKKFATVTMPPNGGGAAGVVQPGSGQESGQEGDQPDPSMKPTDVNGKKINQHQIPTYKNEFEKRMGQRGVERAILRAKEQDKGQSRLPGMVENELERMQEPAKIDWRAVLANYVAVSIPAQSHKTWSRLNRRFPYLLKGKRKVPAPLIGVAMDTSGSVSDDELKAFLNEIDYLRKLHKAEMCIVQCDSAIEKVQRLKPKDRMPNYIAGRGGTEYIPALKFFDKEKKRPDVVVFFTDLEVCDSDIPDEPRNYKIIWVGTNKDRCEYYQEKGKYGKFIPLDLDD